ncbi:MAG TPA: hypothetical protein VIG52_01310, partial [Methyloceanibacter sp.]
MTVPHKRINRVSSWRQVIQRGLTALGGLKTVNRGGGRVTTNKPYQCRQPIAIIEIWEWNKLPPSTGDCYADGLALT